MKPIFNQDNNICFELNWQDMDRFFYFLKLFKFFSIHEIFNNQLHVHRELNVQMVLCWLRLKLVMSKKNCVTSFVKIKCHVFQFPHTYFGECVDGKVKIRIKLDHRTNRIKPVTTEP
jgi:hypothetical protein